MFKSIFKAVAVSAVAAFFCVGCGDKSDEDPDEGGGEVKASYTITFNANGGTVSPTSAKTGEDGKLASLPTPTRTGYTFDGWYTAATGGTEVAESRVYTANATIYAHWKEESVGSSYTITFDANDGTVSPTSAKTGDDGKLDSLPEPTRSGYVFDGWYTAAKGGTAVTESRVFSANTTIYARWAGIPTPTKTTFKDSRDGKNYQKIAVGSQVWMAENLNYDAEGSVCYGNKADSCAKYGRLYDWDAAMRACPSGWHLPDDDEWTILTDYVGDSLTAGTKLKSKTGWNSSKTVPVGTDSYGFSALPGGIFSDGFTGIGVAGGWWTATEYTLSASALDRAMRYDDESFFSGRDIKTKTLSSVRCVEGSVVFPAFTITFAAYGGTVSPTSAKTDEDGKLTSLPTPTRSGYVFAGWYTAETGGTAVTTSRLYGANAILYARWTTEPVTPPSGNTFTDSRDGKSYKKVTIGTQTWMAENLNYDIPNVGTDVCYNNRADSCAKYGRLYNWATAMGIDATYNASEWNGNDVNYQGICPAGWHLPTTDEWTTLVNYVGGTSIAGKKLKSTRGWVADENGTDNYGFSALPGGIGYDNGTFNEVGVQGYWCSASEFEPTGVMVVEYYKYAWGWWASILGDSMWRDYYTKTNLYSVRCVHDE